MTFTAEQIPIHELNLRHEKCRAILREQSPQAEGLLVFSRTNIYYLSGTRANGILWLPLDGEPVLLMRKAEQRCRLESALSNFATFKSYSSIPEICANFGSPLGALIAAEMNALPWSLAQMLKERLKNVEFIEGDNIFMQARYIKTAYEIEKLYNVDALHNKALNNLITGQSIVEKYNILHESSPKKLCINMTEREISHAIWHNFYAHGHGGMLRMHGLGQEVFLGKIAVGENALYPTPFKGPAGLLGEHPAIPFMGNAGSVWKTGQLLLLDTGFINAGYHSALTLTCFAGSEQSTPKVVQQAHNCCFEILLSIKENLNKNYECHFTWGQAKKIAEKYGFKDEFMGINDNKSHVLGSSIGLNMEEGSVFAKKEQCELSAGVVFNVCPMIAIPKLGMVGIRHSFEVREQGEVVAFPHFEQRKDMVFIE